MCIDPVTLIAAGVSAAGSVMQGAQASAAYRTQAKFANRQAVMEQQHGAYEAERLAKQNDQRLASMRADYTHAGVALSGSPGEVLASSAQQASLDEQAIKYGAEVRAGNARFEGRVARANASSAMAGGVIGAISPFVNAWSDMRERNQRRTMINNPYVLAGA